MGRYEKNHRFIILLLLFLVPILCSSNDKKISDLLGMSDEGFRAWLEYKDSRGVLDKDTHKTFKDYLEAKGIQAYEHQILPSQKIPGLYIESEHSKVRFEDGILLELMSHEERAMVGPDNIILDFNDKKCPYGKYELDGGNLQVCFEKGFSLEKPDMRLISRIYCESFAPKFDDPKIYNFDNNVSLEDINNKNNYFDCAKIHNEIQSGKYNNIEVSKIDQCEKFKLKPRWEPVQNLLIPALKFIESVTQKKKKPVELQSAIEDLESNFPDLCVISITLKYKVGKGENGNIDYYKIMDFNNFEIVNVDQGIHSNIIGEGVFPKFKLESRGKKILDLRSLSEDSIIERIHEHFHEKKEWKCDYSSDVLLRKTYKEGDVQILKPVYQGYCAIKNEESNEEIEKVSIVFSAIDFKVYEIKELPVEDKNRTEPCSRLRFKKEPQGKVNAWTLDLNSPRVVFNVSSEDSKFQFDEDERIPSSQLEILENNIYGHLDRLNSLFSATVNYELLESDYSIGSNCETAHGGTDDICLNSKNGKLLGVDATIIAHEFAHSIVPKVLYCEDNKYINKKEINLNFTSLFHDLADAIANAYTNHSCVGQSVSQAYKCHDQDTSMPRSIDSRDSLSKSIPLEKRLRNRKINKQNRNKPLEHIRAQVAARMLQIPHNLFKEKYSSVKATILHWVFLVRSIYIYDSSIDVCLSCDLDYFMSLQRLMEIYTKQVLLSNEKPLLPELLFRWGIEGYLDIHYSCIDSDPKNKGDCIIGLKNPVGEYHGLAISRVTVANKRALELQVKTGVQYSFDFDKKLKKVSGKCNSIIRLELYKCKNDQEPCKRTKANFLFQENISNHNNQDCISRVNINEKDACDEADCTDRTYKNFINNICPSENIFYRVVTCESNEDCSFENRDSGFIPLKINLTEEVGK